MCLLLVSLLCLFLKVIFPDFPTLFIPTDVGTNAGAPVKALTLPVISVRPFSFSCPPCFEARMWWIRTVLLAWSSLVGYKLAGHIITVRPSSELPLMCIIRTKTWNELYANTAKPPVWPHSQQGLSCPPAAKAKQTFTGLKDWTQPVSPLLYLWALFEVM